MNIEQARALTDDELRIKVAESEGIETLAKSGATEWYYNDVEIPESSVPDYVNDLNAMHEAEKLMTWQRFYYDKALYEMRGDFCIYATAKQRAIAFVVAMTEGA